MLFQPFQRLFILTFWGIILFLKQNTVAQTPVIIADTMFSKSRSHDSLKYSKFKAFMYQKRFTRKVYKSIFSDNYNSSQIAVNIGKLNYNSYQEFNDYIVKSFEIKVLNVEGYSVYDVKRTPTKKLSKIVNKFHHTTDADYLAKYFLTIEEGDLFDAEKALNIERAIRSNRTFRDARFIIQKLDAHHISVLLLIQDVWSLIPSVKFSSFDDYELGLKEINLWRRAHQVALNVGAQTTYLEQAHYFEASYFIPSLIPKMFLSGQINLENSYQNRLVGIKFQRPFYNPTTKWAGALELYNNRKLYEFYTPKDSLVVFKTNATFLDYWIGRSFKTSLRKQGLPVRLNIAIKKQQINYFRLTEKTDQGRFQDINQWLFSMGLSARRYRRDVLIYSFGKTEDVPIGSLLSLTLGVDKAGLGDRQYASISYVKGSYIGKFGYINTNLSFGTYIKKSNDAGILNIGIRYFTPLLSWNKKLDGMKVRQFINLYYTRGFNRYEQDYIYIQDAETGFQDVNSMFLRGVGRWITNLESVYITNINFLGFRFAPFNFIDIGKIIPHESHFNREPFYYGLGFGLRFRNESFTVSNLQFHASYYPTIPNTSSGFNFKVSSTIALRFKEFNTEEPEIIPFK